MARQNGSEITITRMVRPMFAALIGLTLLQAVNVEEPRSFQETDRDVTASPRFTLHVPASASEVSPVRSVE